MNRKRFYILGLLVFLMGWGAPGLAEDRQLEDLPRVYQEFLERERMNSTKAEDVTTEVADQYQPEARKTIRVNYIEIPVSDLHVVDSGLEARAIRRQVFVTRGGKKFMRFFVHPESEGLYKPLIEKYGFAGYFNAAATASTRSMLMWDPKTKAKPFFAKLSLDKVQDVLGRAISDWEVRRSVAITKLARETGQSTWKKHRTHIIPEVFGAYVPEEYRMGTYIDKSQGTIYQHGLIFRDASFIEDGNVYPAFSLFSEREGGKEPLIVEWWKKSGMTWKEFIKERFFRPLGDSVNYMSMVEGMHPDFHLQNFLVRVDPRTKRIVEVYHRDLGSFKIDLRMRAARGKSNEPLRTENAFYDFKPEWGTELYGKTLLGWCWKCNFINHYSNFQGGYKVLKKHVPRYDADAVLKVVEEVLREDARKYWGLEPGKASSQEDFSRLAEDFIESRLKVVTPDALSEERAEEVERFVRRQRKEGQTITMPFWELDPTFTGKDYKVTEDGVLFARRSWWFGPRKAHLALYTTPGGPDDIAREGARPSGCSGLFRRIRSWWSGNAPAVR